MLPDITLNLIPIALIIPYLFARGTNWQDPPEKLDLGNIVNNTNGAYWFPFIVILSGTFFIISPDYVPVKNYGCLARSRLK